MWLRAIHSLEQVSILNDSKVTAASNTFHFQISRNNFNKESVLP